jgi:hypothetical protein
MLSTQKIFQRTFRPHILDAHWDQNYSFADRPFNLAFDLGRTVGVGREYQQHDVAGVNRADNGGTPIIAG